MRYKRWFWIVGLLILCLTMLVQMIVPSAAYADYYQAYTGTGTSYLAINVSTYKDSISATISASPNPIYVPGNMGAGIIKLRLYVSNNSSTTYWYHYTYVTIPIYGIDSNGNQTLVCNITISNFPPASGSELYFGPFYLGQNYRGFKLGTPSASPAQYTSASASINGNLTFEFYSLVFASTESQFTTLSNNAASAATNAQNAYNAANAAKSSADAAKSSADAAKTSANTAATNAQNAYNAANTAATNAQNAYNAANTAAAQTIYNGQSAAYWAYLAAQGGTDTTPPTIQKVAGQNGATCTSTGTFYVVIQATDNKAGQLQARAQVDGGTWTGWYNIPQSAIPVSLSSVGAHTITVEVKDPAGNSSQATMTAFRV